MKRFVVCSGKVNRFGYRCLPEGIMLTHYIKNPVLLGMHKSQMLSIGKVINFRIDTEGEAEGMLTAEPEFDMDDPVAAEYARKYEKGYINACSMGHDPIETSDDLSLVLPGQTLATVTKTELLEISMTNIPGDRDAVGLTLDATTGGDLSRLPAIESKIINDNKNSTMDNTTVSKLLGLPETSSDTEITQAITSLQLQAKNANEEKVNALMQLGKTKGIITDENLPNYKQLAFADYGSISAIIEKSEPANPTKEVVTPAAQLSIKDQLKDASGEKKTIPGTLTYDQLSKENPDELLRIKNEDPALYSKLSAEHTKGLKTFK